MELSNMNLNTSHVKVKQKEQKILKLVMINLNTSHVKVKLKKILATYFINK